MSIEIRKLASADIDHFVALIRVFGEVFEMEHLQLPAKAYLQQLLAQEGFCVFVALNNETVAGGLTAYELKPYYNTRPLVYVYDLAVSMAYQRRGIGKALMSSLREFCEKRGAAEIFVQADAEDDHALDFYRAIGGRAQEVVHFSYPLLPGSS